MEHRVKMVPADDYRAKHYGITHESDRVWRVRGSSSPTRVVAWSNVNRPNPHPGEVKWNEFGPVGGDGKYLDAQNQATDDEVTVLFSPEASGIYRDRPNTGHEGSGQVWAEQHEPFATGDVLILVYPDVREETRTVTLTNNGHGRTDLVPVPPTYTQEQVAEAVNEGADTVMDALDIGDRDRDLVNLIVNAALTALDQPGANFAAIVAANYTESVDEVTGWLD